MLKQNKSSIPKNKDTILIIFLLAINLIMKLTIENFVSSSLKVLPHFEIPYTSISTIYEVISTKRFDPNCVYQCIPIIKLVSMLSSFEMRLIFYLIDLCTIGIQI